MRKRRLYAVTVGYLSVRFDRRVDANRFRRVLEYLDRQGWKVPEGLALRLRDLCNARQGRPAWSLYADAVQAELAVPKITGPAV